MRSANIGLRAPQWSLSLMLLGALAGCHWDLFGSDAADSASNAPAATFTVGGTVSGLASGGNLTLLNSNSDSLRIAANGAFTFATALPANASYAVTTGTEPTGQNCTVNGGAGTISAANVSSVVVTCADQTFALGGTIQGLNGSGLVLANGSTTVTVPSGAQSFTFPTSVAYGSSYSVSVKAQPTGLACAVNAGSGTMPANAVASIVVSCTVQTFTVGGTIAGLGAITGLVIMNGTDTLNVPANATHFTMPASVAYGAQYNVTIAGDPTATACVVTNGSGTSVTANVTNIAIYCKTWVESVLYSFAGPPGDGAEPFLNGLLLASDGNFYGLTSAGGVNNDGTVFKITPAGVETVLWSFGNGNDGTNPCGSLIQASDGNFYGMTSTGGLNQAGTVFKITPAGVETLLLSFSPGNNGYYPYGSLIQGSDGNFYGTAGYGGSYGLGTVFRITPAGVATVLWSFGNDNDGLQPMGSLVEASDGNFYGTTNLGGVNAKGTIFSITPAGAEGVLWSFGGNGDGAYPVGSLTLGSDGNYYGYFGPYANEELGGGGIFKITLGGAESLFFSFNGYDGDGPQGRLLLGTDGNLYGMAQLGGNENAGSIFQITPGGAETLIWSFGTTASDGSDALGSLILGPGGGLYGMTEFGGANNLGAIVTLK